MRTIIRNSTVITAADTVKADVLIEDGIVTAVANHIHPGPDDRVIDASGKYLFPGMIDEHTHLGSPFNNTFTAPWRSETVAAAYGGTTTVIDFAVQGKGKSLSETLGEWKKKAEEQSAIDYGFHIAISDFNESVLREMPSIIKDGVTSFKLFMAYKGELMVDDAAMYRILKTANTHGALVMVHAENGDLVEQLQNECFTSGLTAPIYHAVSRPAAVEAEATRRAVTIAELAGAPLFIVHVTADQAAGEIRKAKARGLHIYAETCPHYLLLTVEELNRPDFEGAKFVCSPPLREPEDLESLWNALQDQTIQTIGSDHCAYHFHGQKEMGRGDFRKIPNGGNGIEHRLTLLFTYGVKRNRMNLNRLVDLLSTAPAKFFGLYPRKGTIQAGSDADLVLFDPDVRSVISHQHSHQEIDYNMFEGFEIEGAVTDVWLRGKRIIENGCYTGALSDGAYIVRSPFGAAFHMGAKEI